MINIYKTDLETDKFIKIDSFEKGSWINLINPTNEEINKVCKNVGVLEEFIRYPLDYEEKARIDIEDEAILFILDVPIIEKNDEQKIYSTMPIGMIVVRDDFFITVSLKKNKIIEDFEKEKVKNFYSYKKSRFLFQIFYINASYYLTLLQMLNKETEIAEEMLKKIVKNKEILNLLNLEKSLVYLTTSLKSNELVMEKTLRGKIIKLYDEDEDILEDAIVENKQAIEMSKIYGDILNSSMDIYSSIASNNLNSAMKFLTAITIVLSLPTMVASFWGMNVKLPLENQTNGFIYIILLSIIISIISIIFLRKKDMF